MALQPSSPFPAIWLFLPAQGWPFVRLDGAGTSMACSSSEAERGQSSLKSHIWWEWRGGGGKVGISFSRVVSKRCAWQSICCGVIRAELPGHPSPSLICCIRSMVIKVRNSLTKTRRCDEVHRRKRRYGDCITEAHRPHVPPHTCAQPPPASSLPLADQKLAHGRTSATTQFQYRCP
jgi:hypothetical protein